MDIKTYIAAAVVALTAACTQQEAPAPAPEANAVTEVNADGTAVNPADRDHSEAREAHTPTSN
jgi:hypothetical protein